MRLIRLVALFVSALLFGCGGGGQSQTVPVVGTISATAISSTNTGLAYDVKVWLPEGYSQSTARYPVIYAMDCEYRFDTLTQVLQNRSNKLILINVCAMGSARRWIDFTMPGATSYYNFLTLELIPFVDARYRTDIANRTLTGHSLSGQFVLYALYLENPTNRYFTSIVSEECSCWYDAAHNFSQLLSQPIAMEQAMYQASHQLPINLVMAGDIYSNQIMVAAAYATIATRNYQFLRSTQSVYGLGHVGMDGQAFKDALVFIFGTN